LSGRDGKDRRAWDYSSCREAMAAVKPAQSVSLVASIAKLFRAGEANVQALKLQPPLPETAGEVCTVAEFLQSANDAVLLGATATEREIKARSADGRLADARVVHFATHGLLARETALFKNVREEPALLLSPPEAPSADDDGLLLASEIAALKLNADWVVLSACNTAGGDSAGAESLSGLARAFFYAGAKALLVSNWAVNSDAAVKLVTGAFNAQAKDGGIGRAQALRRASLDLIAAGGASAHPAFWAPFVVAGEGGSASERSDRAYVAVTGSVTRAAAAADARGLEERATAPKPAVKRVRKSKAAEPKEAWSPKMFGDW
jgi:CHAT domain-containing protein